MDKLAGRSQGVEPTVEILLRSDRVLWRPGRCMMQGAADRMHETLFAAWQTFLITRASSASSRTKSHADGEILVRDVPLTTAAVNKQSLRALRHVHERTCMMTERRIRCSQLERPLEKPCITLPGGRPAARQRTVRAVRGPGPAQGGRRAAGSLRRHLRVGQANDRLMEYGNFRPEAKLEIWIIVILLAELVVMLADIGFHIWRELN